MQFFASLLLLLLFLLSVLLGVVCSDDAVKSDIIQADIKYAIEELKNLSASDVYTTLEVDKILHSNHVEGIYHHNTILKVLLSSPYFKSNQAVEEFHIVVMTNKENGAKSFAIDEFPKMKDETIELFSNNKVERKRVLREAAFRRLELEALLLGEEISSVDATKRALKAKMDKQTVEALLGELDTPLLLNHRIERSINRQRRIRDRGILVEERVLSGMGLNDLYLTSIGVNTLERGDDGPVSDYQKERARQMLDESIEQLHSQFNAL